MHDGSEWFYDFLYVSIAVDDFHCNFRSSHLQCRLLQELLEIEREVAEGRPGDGGIDLL